MRRVLTGTLYRLAFAVGYLACELGRGYHDGQLARLKDRAGLASSSRGQP